MARIAPVVTAEIEAEVAEFRRILLEEERLSERSREFQAALVLHTACLVGTKNLQFLSRATRVHYQLVLRFAQQLRAAGIWREDGKIEFEADPEEDSLGTSVEFWLHVLVALGKLKRFPPDAAPQAEKEEDEPVTRQPVPCGGPDDQEMNAMPRASRKDPTR
jgi:hypothetical protein